MGHRPSCVPVVGNRPAFTVSRNVIHSICVTASMRRAALAGAGAAVAAACHYDEDTRRNLLIATAGGVSRAFVRRRVEHVGRAGMSLRPAPGARPKGAGLLTVSNHKATCDDPHLIASIVPASMLLRGARSANANARAPWSAQCVDANLRLRRRRWQPIPLGRVREGRVLQGGSLDQLLCGCVQGAAHRPHGCDRWRVAAGDGDDRGQVARGRLGTLLPRG
eukprot:6336946-Prymnesium_polylepis.1